MISSRKIALNIIATYGRTLVALAVGLFVNRGLHTMYIHYKKKGGGSR